MVSTTFFDYGKSLIAAHQIDVKGIDDSVRNILRLKFKLGLFDGRGPAEPPYRSDALHTAQLLAEESAVLLKNRGDVLPLRKDVGKIAVIGPLADSPTDQMGTWAMDGRAEDSRTPLAALRQMLGAERVLYVPALKNTRDMSTGQFDAAVRAAQQADAAVLFLGEEAILSGEARARAFLNLPGAQEQLVQRLSESGKPMVAVVMAGRPLTFHPVAEKLDAILFAFHPGTMGGPAIARLLFGDAVPSGRLTITFPRTVGQVPIYYAHLNTGRPPLQSELGVPLGNPENPKDYTSRYIDVDFTPEYPFGFGLSYSAFKQSRPYPVPPLCYALDGISGSRIRGGDLENRSRATCGKDGYRKPKRL